MKGDKVSGSKKKAGISRMTYCRSESLSPRPIVLEKEIVWLYLILFNILLMIPVYVPPHSLSGYCANEALVCRPEMTRFGGPPERSEGGEGHRMIGPLRVRWRLTIVVS
jgi:hypothetical protein